jgi:hypothetical protein
MSFVERNKAWLLPLLAVGLGAVVYMNIQAYKTPSTPTNAEPTPAPEPTSTQPPALPNDKPSEGTSNQEIWADLRRLEAPWHKLNDSAGILESADRRLDLDTPAPTAHPQSQAWSRLTNPKRIKVESRGMEAASPQPAPRLSFVAQTPSGSVAWIAGLPYSSGQVAPGGYRVKQIKSDSVIFEGPQGPVVCWTHGIKSDPSPRR